MDRWDLYLSRGATLSQEMMFKENGAVIDLTGYTARSQVREEPDGGALICEMMTAVYGPTGTVIITIGAETSAGLASGVYCWDLKLTAPGGVTEYYIGGQFTVQPTVTE